MSRRCATAMSQRVMAMNNRPKILRILVVLGLSCITLRFCYVKFFSMSDGQHQKSPNGLYLARLSGTECQGFFGDNQSYYEFTIEQHKATKVAMVRYPLEGDQVPVKLRGDGWYISWAEDSNSVTFDLSDTIGTTLTFDLSNTIDRILVKSTRP